MNLKKYIHYTHKETTKKRKSNKLSLTKQDCLLDFKNYINPTI